jgi:uncharacterized membrane protein YhfC
VAIARQTAQYRPTAAAGEEPFMPSPPSPLFLLIGIGMTAVAIIAVLWWRRWTGASRAAFGLGALAWVVGVALKFGWAVPLNPLIRQGLDRALPGSIAAPVYWLYVGLLTGVFECGITLLFVKRSRLKAAGWHDAVAFGVGFGAIEALLLGLIQFVGLLIVIAFWDHLPEDARTAIGTQPSIALGIGFIPLPVAERLSALLAHVFTCTLIVHGVRVGAWRWFWVSFAYKTALDAFAAWGILATQMTKSLSGMMAFEAAAGAFAVVGLAGLAFLRRRFRSLADLAAARVSEPGSAVLAIGNDD